MSACGYAPIKPDLQKQAQARVDLWATACPRPALGYTCCEGFSKRLDSHGKHRPPLQGVPRAFKPGATLRSFAWFRPRSLPGQDLPSGEVMREGKSLQRLLLICSRAGERARGLVLEPEERWSEAVGTRTWFPACWSTPVGPAPGRGGRLPCSTGRAGWIALASALGPSRRRDVMRLFI